jgi:hypothetical protein
MTIANDLTITMKVGNLYVAYAPDADLCYYGGCFEEATNGLTEELQNQAQANAGQRAGGSERSQP